MVSSNLDITFRRVSRRLSLDIGRAIKNAMRDQFHFTDEKRVLLLVEELSIVVDRFLYTRLGTSDHLDKQEAYDDIFLKLRNDDIFKLYIDYELRVSKETFGYLKEFNIDLGSIITIDDGLSILERLAFWVSDDLESKRFSQNDLFDSENEVDLKNSKRRQISQLRRLVPDQKIAPVQFNIVKDILVVERRKSSAGEDADIAAPARSALIASGRRVIDNLRATNCDGRMLEAIEVLQEKLEREQDIIELGVLNISCEVLAAKFDNELPDAISGLLIAHARGISGYVAQFPQWRRFSENASVSELTNDHIEMLSEISEKLAISLQNIPNLVSPEVPKTILFLRSLILNPGEVPKRAGFALLRTLENLWARVYGYAADFLDASIKRAIGIAATGVAVTLVTIAANSALEAFPVTSKLADSAWVQSATKIIKRQLEALKKNDED